VLKSPFDAKALARATDRIAASRAWRMPALSLQTMRAMESLRLFIVIVGASLVLLLLWAALAKVDRVVRVEGKIIPAGRSQEIQHLEGGIIAAIEAKEGAVVKQGDVLLTIDDTAAGVNLGETKAKLASQTIRSLRLEAEANGRDAIEFPPDYANAPEAEGERHLFQSRRAKLDEELRMHGQTIEHRRAELADAEARIKTLGRELEVAKKRSSMLGSLAEKEVASKLDVLEAQSREGRLDTEMSAARNSVPTLNAAIAEEEARASTVKAEFRSQAQGELVTVLADIAQLNQALTVASDRVKRTEVRSPIDGIVNRIAVNTLGGVVKPGETLIEIIPDTSQVLIEARAKPQDRGNLRPGLDATVRVSAYDAGEFGLLQGRVTEVSADTVQDPRVEPYYRVNVLIDRLPSSYASNPLVPGMTVSGDIVTGRRTVLRYLLSPLGKFTYQMLKDSR
jgi:adhesin transport system membrane fusion protein